MSSHPYPPTASPEMLNRGTVERKRSKTHAARAPYFTNASTEAWKIHLFVILPHFTVWGIGLKLPTMIPNCRILFSFCSLSPTLTLPYLKANFSIMLITNIQNRELTSFIHLYRACVYAVRVQLDVVYLVSSRLFLSVDEAWPNTSTKRCKRNPDDEVPIQIYWD